MLARACVSFAPAFAGQYYSTCAVGFSAVLFAMKVVLNSSSPGWSSVAGISLPTKVSHVACVPLAWWVRHHIQNQLHGRSIHVHVYSRCQ